jgi:colanic acid/amylovoran biosynthesis protein
MKPLARNLLMINYNSPRNAGDAALSDMAVASAHAAFPEARLEIAINDPDSASEIGNRDFVQVLPSFAALCGAGLGRPRIGAIIWIVAASLAAAMVYRMRRRLPAWVPEELRSLLSAYLTADLVVSKPGSLFVTMGRFGLPFLQEAFAVAYALMLGKPFYVLPQSMGPLRRTWERAAIRHLYGRARIVYLRDPVSLRLARELRLPAERLRMVPDMAFALPQASTERAAEALAHAGAANGPRMGVTVLNRLLRDVKQTEWERYESSMAEALARFARQRGIVVVFFPQVTGPTEREDDRIAARRIMARMGLGDQAVLIEEPTSPALLKAMYREMDVVVATRMHSAIFALSNAVPTLMIVWLDKVRGLAELLGLEPWTLNLTQVDEASLGALLERLWQSRPAVRAQLEKIMPDLLHQIGSVSETIASDYYA